MTLDDENQHDASSRKKKLYRLVAVSFGLLCVLQAALNISLRLTLYNSESKTPGIEAGCKNLTEERDELKENLTDFALQLNSLTGERDELKRELNNSALQLNSLTGERDELKRELNNSALQLNSLTGERDELKRELNNSALQLNSLTGERDELKRELNVWAHYSKQGWVYFSGSVYYISSIEKTWKASRDDCLQKGADLMIINSKEEQDFTRQLKDNMWIGLTDSETEGTWKWVHGTPLTTSYCMDGEPNGNRTEEDCGEVKYHKKENSWNDKPCDLSNFWICEKKVSL